MYRSDLDAWVEASPGAKAFAEPNIVLLPPDPYANSANETLPFRSTTYDAKPLSSSSPFQSGSVYLQDHEEHPNARTSAANLCMEELSLPMLYTAGYRAHLKSQREKGAVGVSLPSAPPDFDGSAPTNPEAVAQHVHGLAKAYNSVKPDPTPFDMRRHIIVEAANEFAALNVIASTNQQQVQLNNDEMNSTTYLEGCTNGGDQGNRAATATSTDGDSRQTTMASTEALDNGSDSGIDEEDDPFSAHYASATLNAEALSLSMALAALPQQTSRAVVQVLRRRLQAGQCSAPLVSGCVVSLVLTHCEQYITMEGKSLSSKCELLSLAGLLVCTRGRIREVLRYLGILEAFHRSSADILPALVPSAADIVDAFSFNIKALCPVVSPLDCHQEDARLLRVSLSEGTTAQCFCVSPDGQLLAVATLRGIILYDTTSGAVVAEKDFAEWNRLSDSAANSMNGSSMELVAVPEFREGPATPQTATSGSAAAAAVVLSAAPPTGSSSVTLQHIHFTEDASHLVATHSGGVRHWVFASDLSTMEEHNTSTVALCVNYKNGVLETQPLPLLPSGSTTHALLHTQRSSPVFTSRDWLTPEPTAELILCTHLCSDYTGVVARVHTDVDELTVEVCGDTVVLAQSDAKCFATVGVDSKWLFLQVRWTRGVWSLMANDRLVELRGPRCGQAKSVFVRSVECLGGTGHAASFSMWTSTGDSTTAVRTFARERRLEPCVKALIHLPLDEGTGMWVKETVSSTCVPLSDLEYVWSNAMLTPCHSSYVSATAGTRGSRARKRACSRNQSLSSAMRGTAAAPGGGNVGSAVRLDEKLLLSCQILVSAFKVYIMLPGSTKGSDDTVAEVDRASNTIVRVYRCPRLCSENLYSLVRDESELMVFQPRFSTFSSSRLFTARSRESELAKDGALYSADSGSYGEEEESVLWLLHELYKKLYLESSELYRVPVENSPLSISNLRYLTQQLCALTATAERMRVVALLSLTLVHFQKLITADEKELSQIAASLKTACSKVLSTFTSSGLIQRVATTLLHSATRKSLTLQDKVDALLDADTQRSATVLRECLTKESFFAVVQHIIAGSADQLVAVAKRLLLICKNEENQLAAAAARCAGAHDKDRATAHPMGTAASGPGGAGYLSQIAPTVSSANIISSSGGVEGGAPSLTRLLVWFAVASVTVLQSHDRIDVISQLLELFTEYMAAALAPTSPTSPGSLPPPQQTAVHTGCLPFLIAVAEFTPEAVTPSVEQSLFALLERIRGSTGCAMEREADARRLQGTSVAFCTREAFEVYPEDRESPDATWRLNLDYSRAVSVSVHKETSALPLSIVCTDCKRQSSPMVVEMTAERPFAKMKGGEFFFFGKAENAFTVVAQFELTVDGSWTTLVRDTLQHLLLCYAARLTHRSTPGDTYVPSFMRHGLSSDALLRCGIDLPGRDQTSRVAVNILEDIGEGKEFVSQVLRNMRGSIVPSMRPAIQALLAILVHSGATMSQAEDELKLRWFSGEWGSKLQSATRDTTRAFLRDLATWVTGSLYNPPESPATLCPGASLSFHRRLSADRRQETSMNASRSFSERRGSTSSRRSVFKTSHQAETLDQVRTLLSKDVSTAALESILAERTHAAMKMARGLTTLLRLLSSTTSPSMPTTTTAGNGAATGSDHKVPERLLLQVLQVLWQFASVESGTHFLDSLSGAGVDLEAQVRSGFHSVLVRCEELLLDRSPKTVAPQAVLSEMAVNGRATMMLFALLCHPWDAVDCEHFIAAFGKEGDLLQHLEDQVNIPTCTLTLTSPWRLRRETKLEMSASEERALRSELLGAADTNSLSRIFPNDFSIVIPQLDTSRSENGVILEKSSSNSVVVRADEGWPLTWREGMPRVFYFEVSVRSAVSALEVGLLLPKADRGLSTELNFFYSSSGETHTCQLPAYGLNDTVGCGILTTSRRVFFTLNGKFISIFSGTLEKHDVLFPALRLEERSGVKVLVNFGTAAFSFDFRQLHPSLSLQSGPTWYRVASTAEIVLHYIVTRACAIQETKKPCARLMLSHSCEVVCRNVNKVTSSLMNVCLEGSPSSNDSGTRIKQAVIFAVTEYSLMVLIATMRHMVNAGIGAHSPHSDSVGEMVFAAASVLMLVPLHSIQIATISLLPEVIPHVRQVADRSAPDGLVRRLFEHAYGPAEGEASNLIPFVPTWRECDARCMSIANAQYAYMIPDAQRSIVLGNPLPRTGTVMFTVKVNRRGMSKGHSLKGGYFIGVSVVGLSPLSPTSNSQSWKAVKPPIVWAIHDTSPQLPHATNPTVKPNNFQRTFGNDDAIRVVVNRDQHTIDFYRDDEFLKTLFSDVPADLELVPFVQLYNDDASAHIFPGQMSAPISAATLLSAASVDVLRSMLTLEPFQELVGRGVCEELDRYAYPKVTLALFNSVPDPRLLQLQSGGPGDGSFISVSRVSDMRCKFSIGTEANYEHIYNLRAPANAKITCSFDSAVPTMFLDGLQMCVGKLVAALRRLVLPLITLKALNCLEQEKRRSIIDEEKDHWDFLFHGLRVSTYLNIQQASQSKSLLTVPRIPVDFTFSAALSHPKFAISSNYCGRLATVPNGVKNATPPFIAIAEPSIPIHGKFSIRCQLIRGHNGQILGGGYYFGVCTEAFNWKRKELNSVVPEVWAFHDMDDAPWRLRHMHPTATFQITADPRCIIVSGDIIRLEIDRDEGTMHVFRKPMNGEEVSLGLIFDKIPGGVKLYPFVHLFNVDAVAVLLPSNSSEPAVRLTVQQPHFATWPTNERRYCDGCAAAHSESKLTQRWYKCNECADYALCTNCFDLCVHSYHAFTEMGVPYFAYSKLPPVKLKVGMRVVLPGTSAIYLRSGGCRMHEDQINCVAEAVEDNGFAIWGIVCKQKAQFTVYVDTTDGEPLSADHPMFIGVGAVEEITQLSREKLRSKCYASTSTIACFSSDSTLRRRMDCESRSPYGFNRGATITLDIDLAKRTVSFVRDWIVVGTRPLELSASAASLQFPLCCFVVFGRKNAKVSVFPERGRTVLASVEESASLVVNVSFVGDGRTRYIPADGCRLPLRPAVKGAVAAGRLGYTYVDKQLVQCRVVAADKDELRVHCLHEDSDLCIPPGHFLVDDEDLIAEERLTHKETDGQGVSLEGGFVISRLLLILSCLCENDTLSPLVMAYYGDLTRMLRGLSSVHIGNEAPLDFLQEIRTSITATANSVRGAKGKLLLSSFVPTLSVDDRKRKFKAGMLVRDIVNCDPPAAATVTVAQPSTAAGKPVARPSSAVYRVRARKGETLFVESVETRVRAEMSFKNSIPVKKSGDWPWFTLPNGLPCSLLEHTARVANPDAPPMNVSIDGEWQGEMTFAKFQNLSVELSLVSSELNPSTSVEAASPTSPSSAPPPGGSADAVEATAGPPRRGGSYAHVGNEQAMTGFTVMFEHSRYGRTVSMCLVPQSSKELQQRMADLQRQHSMPFAEKVARVFLATSHSARDRALAVDVELDADGLRMNGTCRTSDGKMGTVAANWTSRVSFAPVTTDTAHIEPLPDCADAVIPPPPRRDVCDTMRRLIVLLARHLYLVICNKIQSVSKDFVEHIFLFHTHPLTDRLASHLVNPPHLYFMVSEACQLILDPAVRPWDAATLSSLVTKTLLLRSDATSVAPDSLVWDALHAVVVAAHRCGCYYRHQILRNITTFVENYKPAPQIIYAQLFAALFSYVDRNALAAADVVETRKDISAGVDLILTVKGPLEKTVTNVPTQPLWCLIDVWQSLLQGRPLPAVIDNAANRHRSGAETEEVFAKGAFGDFKDDELRVGKVVSSCAAGSRGRYYYEVVLPDRLSAPFAVGWGTEVHGDVPSQHVGSDRFSFAFNGNDVTTKESKEEYKVAHEIMPSSVIGCLLDMETRTVAWSVDGSHGVFIPIPIALLDADELFAFASIGTCNGMRVRLRASQFEYVPDGYTDLSHRYTHVLVDNYDESKRSTLPPRSLNFYTQLASYLSDLEEAVDESQNARQRATSYTTVNNTANNNGSVSVSAVTVTAASPRMGGSSTSTPAHDRVVQAATRTLHGGEPATPVTPISPSYHNSHNNGVASLTAMAAAAVSLNAANTSVSAETLFLPKYQLLSGVSRSELEAHTSVIATVESCMATANRFVDLDGDTVSGALSAAFVYVKPLVRRSFRRKLLVNVPGVEKVTSPASIVIKANELYSTLPRSPEAALQHTVLSQLYKQIGSFTEAQWGLSPLFRVNLYVTSSGHAPIDMGGPYRQTWTLLAEEIMRHPDKCFPHSEFHRNPLFVFVNNSHRVSLVPDCQATASYDLTLFNFLGKVMGHAARARFPLDIDFSPFLWKFLVDDTLSVKDYYQHVDSVVETSMADDSFLLSGIAEEIIPGFAEKISWSENDDGVGDSVLAQRRRTIAESCLVHSMDEQLGAIRSGLWSVLPRRVVRCLSWRDFEKVVCGETNPSVDSLRRYIRSLLSFARDKFFWQIVEEMSAEQKASLLCFASGQRRLPLIRSITIQENTESVEHLPRSQSCSSLITVPPYTSLEVFREKLFIALQHQAEMELA